MNNIYDFKIKTMTKIEYLLARIFGKKIRGVDCDYTLHEYTIYAYKWRGKYYVVKEFYEWAEKRMGK